MSDPMDRLETYLRTLPNEDGAYRISTPRRFAHDEAQYDQQYSNDPANYVTGQGLLNLLRDIRADFAGPAVEIGCGTGLLSLGLVAGEAYPVTLLTDPSPAFIRIARNKLRKEGLDTGKARFAILAAEDVARLPANTFSLIVLRSTLHHVLDVDQFVRAAARALAPGGMLTCQEPCMEGYVLMGALAQFFPLVVERQRKKLTRQQQDQVQRFIDTMRFYGRRDVDKSQQEDKHLFRVDEIMKMGAAAGLQVDFLANLTYDHYSRPPGSPVCPDTFRPFFKMYLQYCMSFDAGLLDLFDRYFAPYCQFIEDISANGNAPYAHGVFLCRKAAAVAAPGLRTPLEAAEPAA